MKANSDGVFHPSCGAVARHCTTRLENTHGTVCCEVLYRPHPWAGRKVFVVIDKANGIVFRSTLDGSETQSRISSAQSIAGNFAIALAFALMVTSP